MRKEYVTNEIALVLKKLGFAEKCFAYFNPSIKRFVGMQNETTLYYPEHGGECHNWNEEEHLISVPLWQQVIDWLDKEKNKLVYTEHSSGYWVGVVEHSKGYFETEENNRYRCRELAILKAIEICKEKSN